MDSELLVCALLFGDHPGLHERLLKGFRLGVPDTVPVRLWCNQVGEETRGLLAAHSGPSWTWTLSDENVPKYRAMRQMFSGLRRPACGVEWVAWFDDDSWIEAADWLPSVRTQLGRAEVRYIGQPWGVHLLPGQWDFIKEASWFRGREPELHEGKPVLWFAQGAYWWLRTDLLRAIDWPDPRLRHNGGDALLGEAVRQQGYGLTPGAYGVRVNEAPRRGLSERPAGAAEELRR